MVIIKRTKNYFLLRFDRGEYYPDAFLRFLKQKKIHGGFFFGLGALIDPKLAFFDLKRKAYSSKKFRGTFEVLNITGNIAIDKKEIVVHEHVTLGDKRYKVFGGHLLSGEVGGTLEVFLIHNKTLARKLNKKIGLRLLV